MPRPTIKADLIQTANDQFAKLWTLIGEMSDEEKRADIVPNERDKNVRDVLVHLYEWHCLLLNWIRSNTNGKPAPIFRKIGEKLEEHEKDSYSACCSCGTTLEGFYENKNSIIHYFFFSFRLYFIC